MLFVAVTLVARQQTIFVDETPKLRYVISPLLYHLSTKNCNLAATEVLIKRVGGRAERGRGLERGYAGLAVSLLGNFLKIQMQICAIVTTSATENVQLSI